MAEVNERTQRDSEKVVAAIRRCVNEYRAIHIATWEPRPLPERLRRRLL